MEGEPGPQVFTLEAANALIPHVRELVEAQMARRTEIEERLDRLAGLLGSTPSSLEVLESDPPPVRELKIELVVHVERYQSAWREVEATGAVLKDPRAGLLDFYGEVDGKRVWLCWKYGEDAVTHYHGLHEGFSGRKPIHATLRSRHLN
ncbi:MAG TPA: DUF2203 domain-containing protein [Polyangiaceae bacterium]|jgi:hypothetical protein